MRLPGRSGRPVGGTCRVFRSGARKEGRSSKRYWGAKMANKSWFFAAEGKQQGPYPEAQFLDFIARGAITRDTLVWTEGMAGWQKAGEIPGLLAAGYPPTLAGGGYGGGTLSVDFGI